MLINFFLNFISVYFLIVRYFYTKIIKKTNFQTFPGYILLKFKINFLRLYLLKYKIPIIFITGTNGKTSTTHLLTHILKSQNLNVLTNYTGSNLKRGVLSTLVLNRFKKFDYLVFEIDEGSVYEITKCIPKNIKNRYLVLLNLSRDQLDRYGEVDTIASKINDSVLGNNLILITEQSEFSHHFKNKNFINTKLNTSIYTSRLGITDNPHLIINFQFLYELLSLLNIVIDVNKINKFELVMGRGRKFTINKRSFDLHLSKNPVSFNNSLKLILNSDKNNILIVMNDNIPDGRDVSWFYDVDYNLLISTLSSKNVFVAGSRSYDLFNLLKLLNIKSFNIENFSKYLSFCSSFNITDTFILANYSATVSITKTANSYV